MTPASTTKPQSILVVDDEPEICQLVQGCLMASGHKVKCASSGNEACRLLETHRFDVVITDILMSDGDGLDLIDACKKTVPTPRIVAISGGGKWMDGGFCLKVAHGFGAHALVAKPFTCEQLMAAIG